MDLDELKESWKQIGSQKKRMTAETMRTFMNTESASPFVKLRKSMIVEMVLFFISYVLLFAFYFTQSYFNTKPLALYAITSFTILGLLAGVLFYTKVYSHTKKFSFDESLAEQLEQNITSLKADVNMYLNLNLLLFIPGVFLGIVLVSNVGGLGELMNFSNSYWLFMLGLTIALFPLFYFALRIWIRLFYGKYIEELEENYNELVAQEEEIAE